MQPDPRSFTTPLPGIVLAPGESPIFMPREKVRILTRTPIGHYRVPTYLRGKVGVVVAVIQPTLVNNEEEGYGRDAGKRRHYYRISFPMHEVWPNYAGPLHDSLIVEVFETWLERS